MLKLFVFSNMNLSLNSVVRTSCSSDLLSTTKQERLTLAVELSGAIQYFGELLVV